MKKRSWLVLLLAGAADIAAAQTTSTRPPSFGAAAQSSRAARQIDIRAATDLTYDSNVFGVSNRLVDQGSIGSRSKDDFSLTPSVTLNILVPVGRQSLFARGSLGYDFFERNTQLNRERINLEGGANLQFLLNCQSQVSATFNRNRSNAGDVFATTPDPIAVRANTEERTSFGGQAQCGGIAGISPSFGYRHSVVRNTSPFFRFNDSDQDSFDGSLGIQRPSLGRLSLYGSYAKSTFLNRNIFGVPDIFFPGLPRDGVSSYSAGGRFERSIGSRASGSVSIGYSWVNPNSFQTERFRGNSYALSLSLRPNDRFTVDLVASRAADISNTVFSSFAVTELYALNGSYRLTPNIVFNFGSSQQMRDFRGSAASVDNAAFISEDKFTRVYGGLVYDLNRRIKLNGLVSQQRRQADNAVFDYRNTTASIGASLLLGR